jgi:hypothetical protein
MAITQEQRAKLAAGLMRMLELQEKQATLVRAAISLLTQAEWHPAVRANQNQSLTTRSNGSWPHSREGRGSRRTSSSPRAVRALDEKRSAPAVDRRTPSLTPP